MAKGSKAWYEVYENAICFVEDAKEPLEWKQVRFEIDLRRRFFANGNDHEIRNKLVLKNFKNDSLFSTNAGGYSPSKINIALGQIGLLIWIIILIIHLLMLWINPTMFSQCGLFFSVIILSILIIFVIVRLRCYDWIESSYFKD